MKMVKSLLLGSAAGMVALSGAAQAADLPVKAKPVEYVKVCSVYGAGFYYVPGTDTCIKVGGYVRMDVGINAGGSHSPYVNGAGGRELRDRDVYQTRVRGIVTWDARTQTEYGTLRAYINAGWELNTNDPNYRGTIFFQRAFIQFAGLTVGKTQSFFGFYNNALNYTTLQGGGQADTGLNLIAYTAQFAGGFSLSISAEDAAHHRAGIYDSVAGLFPGFVANPLPIGGFPGPAYGDYAGVQWPDIVGNIRVDQPWGSAQVAGAVHQVRSLYRGNNVNANPPGFDETGFAVAGGVMLNLPFAQGDQLWVQGTYAQGATNYLGINPFVQSSGGFAMYSGGRAFPGNASFGGAWGVDAVADATGMSKVEGWAILGAARHFWTPALRSSVFGQYTRLDFGSRRVGSGSANDKACAANNFGFVGPSGTTAKTGCNFDFALIQVGFNTIWSPVRNLDIGVEVLYTRLDQSHSGFGLLPQSGTREAGWYRLRDQDTWSGTVRFQRNFWP